jgi:hypothetical protein
MAMTMMMTIAADIAYTVEVGIPPGPVGVVGDAVGGTVGVTIGVAVGAIVDVGVGVTIGVTAAVTPTEVSAYEL